jgi:phi13 family phage major tail protein
LANKVQYGISNVYYAIKTGDGKYKKPVHMPGGENFQLSNSGGDNNIIYADNMNYWNKTNNTGKSGDLQMAKFPDSFHTDVLGQTKEDGGGFSEGIDDISHEFALLFQLEGDAGGRRVCLFDCTATNPTFTAATATDSVTEASETSTITATAGLINGKKKVMYSCESGDTNYDTFFDKVPLTTEVDSGADAGTGK